MKLLSASLLCAGFCLSALAQQPAQPPKVAPPKTHLKVGDVAPDFKLNATSGPAVALSEFKGKFNVVLAFFPAAFTGG